MRLRQQNGSVVQLRAGALTPTEVNVQAPARIIRNELLRALLLPCAVATFGCTVSQPVSQAPVVAVAPGGDQQERRFVDSVLAGMTLEEKLGQLNQISGVGQPTGPGRVPAGFEQVKSGGIGSFLNVVGRDTVTAL